MPKGRCFISYCHKDVNEDLVEYLRFLLKPSVNDLYEILIDKDVRYGDDFDRFMNLLDTVDLVFLVATPRYKERVNAQEGYVSKEYDCILRRLEAAQTEADEASSATEEDAKLPRPSSEFTLIPILLKGSRADSIPNEIATRRFVDLSGIRSYKNKQGRFFVSDYVKTQFGKQLEELSGHLKSVAVNLMPRFDQLFEEAYDCLFLNLKADWHGFYKQNPEQGDALFVKIYAYRQIERQRRYFTVGRKGSGKSTVTDVLSIRKADAYKGHIAIIADHFNLETLYTLFGTTQIKSDARNVVSQLRCFELGWELFIYMNCIKLIVDLDDRGNLSKEQGPHVPKLRKSLEYVHQRGETLSTSELENVYLTYSFSSIIDFVKDCIEGASEDPRKFRTDIQSRFTRDRLLDFALGKGAIDAFESVLRTCKKRFLITLDGFDVKFDRFRRNSLVHHRETLFDRATFEVEWLRALLLLIMAFKQAREGVSRFNELTEFV